MSLHALCIISKLLNLSLLFMWHLNDVEKVCSVFIIIVKKYICMYQKPVWLMEALKCDRYGAGADGSDRS